MEKSGLEVFFEKFKTIEKKNLTRNERNYYCAILETLLEYTKGGVHDDKFLQELFKIPSSDWDLFFRKINILDRNYRKKHKEVYGCYELFKLGKKQDISKLKKASKSNKQISSKKFIKSLIKLDNSSVNGSK